MSSNGWCCIARSVLISADLKNIVKLLVVLKNCTAQANNEDKSMQFKHKLINYFIVLHLFQLLTIVNVFSCVWWWYSCAILHSRCGTKFLHKKVLRLTCTNTREKILIFPSPTLNGFSMFKAPLKTSISTSAIYTFTCCPCIYLQMNTLVTILKSLDLVGHKPDCQRPKESPCQGLLIFSL